MELTRPSLRSYLSQLQRCHHNIHVYLVDLCILISVISVSPSGRIDQEEFMKALTEEKNLVDILTQNGRYYQGMEL